MEYVRFTVFFVRSRSPKTTGWCMVWNVHCILASSLALFSVSICYFSPMWSAQERVLAGDDVNFVSLRWSWLATVKPQGAATSVATWRVVLFSHHDTASMPGRNALVVDEDDTVRALAGSLSSVCIISPPPTVDVCVCRWAFFVST
jgi:hypothetical protein